MPQPDRQSRRQSAEVINCCQLVRVDRGFVLVTIRTDSGRQVLTLVSRRQNHGKVTCRLDYCNSVFTSLPQSTVEPLQRVQNAAARMIFNLGRHEHVTPCVIPLHWLPVRFRITYKLCILMYNIRSGKCACYRRDIMQPTIASVTLSGLRSHSDTTSYVTPRLHTKFGQRAFLWSPYVI